MRLLEMRSENVKSLQDNRKELLTIIDNLDLIKTYPMVNQFIRLCQYDYSDNEIIKLFTNYCNSDKSVKTSHTKENYIFLYGEKYGLERFNEYSTNNSLAGKLTYSNGRVAKYDHFKKEYWIEKGLTEEDAINKVDARKLKAKTASIVKIKSMNNRSTTQKQYWVDRGFSEVEAIEIIKHRQATCSLERFINRYGPDIGLERYIQRTKKWQDTLNSKSPEEKLRIYKLRCSGFKLSKGSSISKKETLILDYISEVLGVDIDRQFNYIVNDKNYIFDGKLQNIIIEFNGDFWHCNPSKYSPDFIHPISGLKASDIWLYDQLKIKTIEDAGYKVFVIWENELNDKSRIIERLRLLL